MSMQFDIEFLGTGYIEFFFQFLPSLQVLDESKELGPFQVKGISPM